MNRFKYDLLCVFTHGQLKIYEFWRIYADLGESLGLKVRHELRAEPVGFSGARQERLEFIVSTSPLLGGGVKLRQKR